MTNAYTALPLADWPTADREKWLNECQPAQRLRPGGRAATMGLSTQRSHMRSYGYLMEFCYRTGRLSSNEVAARHVDEPTIKAFLIELQTRTSSVTRHSYISRIRRVAEILAPEKDFQWLRLIELDLKHRSRPRSRAGRVVDSRRLWTLGLALMQRAEQTASMTLLRRARLYRDGLMVALLSVCPIRLKNFAALEVNRQLQKGDGAWWLLLTADETKSKRPDERPVPEALTVYIDRWLGHWRCFFRNPQNAFWASTKGCHLAYTFIGSIISTVTLREIGVDVSPHLFRHSAVHTVAVVSGDQMGIVTGVLQHRDPRTTRIYDVKGRSVLAGKALQAIVGELETE